MEELEKEFFLKTQLGGDKPAKITKNDIAIGCPLCNEDTSFGKKQRCHLYKKPNLDQTLVHCYNCGWHSNLPNFLKVVNKDFYEDFRRRKKFSSFNKLKRIKKLNNNEVKNINEPSLFLDFKKLGFTQNVKPLLEYLEKRNLKEFSYLFYYSKDNIFFEDKTLPLKNCLIIPLFFKNKIYGFQARNLDTKFFYTFLPQENSGFKVWNFFNIEKNKPIFIFESVFDALSSGLPLKNIVAGLGADVPTNLVEQLKHPIFCLDNPFKDKKAREKYLQLIDDFHCVIWGRGKEEKDFNELLNKYNKSEIKEYIIKNVKKGLKAKIILELF